LLRNVNRRLTDKKSVEMIELGNCPGISKKGERIKEEQNVFK